MHAVDSAVDSVGQATWGDSAEDDGVLTGPRASGEGELGGLGPIDFSLPAPMGSCLHLGRPSSTVGGAGSAPWIQRPTPSPSSQLMQAQSPINPAMVSGYEPVPCSMPQAPCFAR